MVKQKVVWTPNPGPQTNAITRSEFEVLYGGSRGGGKTDCGIGGLLYDYEHPKFRALVIRKNADDLKDWVDRAEMLFSQFGAKKVGKPADFKFPKGAIVRTNHLRDASAYTKYQGHEYQKMVIEELTHIPRELSYLKLISSCRSTVKDLVAQVFATTNPGEVGHKWVKKRWNLPADIPPEEIYTPGKKGRDRIFVRSTVEDCPQIMKNDPGYVQFLKELPPGLREQWLLGSWAEYDISGSYYMNDIRTAKAGNRIGFVPYEKDVKVYTFWDLGIGDSMVILFVQFLDNKIRIFDCYDAVGSNLQECTKVLQDKGYTYAGHYFPHDINVRELSTGKRRIDIAMKLGIKPIGLVPNIPVDDGIHAVRMIFNKFWIDGERCEPLLEALRNYRKEYDERLGEFKIKPLHDWSSHYADATRMLAVTYNSTLGKEQQPTKLKYKRYEQNHTFNDYTGEEE